MIVGAIRVLLVEDDPGDVDLTTEILGEARLDLNLDVVHDGVEAMTYLKREGKYATAMRPDLILLDLNMPRKSGHEVLEDIKNDPVLRTIPVVVLTTSDAEADILRSYRSGANCYVTKPVGLDEFAKVIRHIENFWCTIVKLPTR